MGKHIYVFSLLFGAKHCIEDGSSLIRVLESYLTCLGGGDDHCLVKSTARLHQDAAIEGRLSLECNGGLLDQKDALHVRTICQKMFSALRHPPR
jgi:hypothetical protein